MGYITIIMAISGQTAITTAWQGFGENILASGHMIVSKSMYKHTKTVF